VTRPHFAASFTAEVGEYEESCEIVGVRGEKHRHSEDNGDQEDQVATEIGEQCCDADAEMIQQGL
jgi:hypothetical protein